MKWLAAIVILSVLIVSGCTAPPPITNFEDCAAAGFPVMESHPRQCRTPDGVLHVEDIQVEKPKPAEPVTEKPPPKVPETPGTVPNATDAGEIVETVTAVVVDTMQDKCYSDVGSQISCPSEGQRFYGQDAQYGSNQASYRDNGDGTVTDLNTGLMWQKDPGSKKTYSAAVSEISSFSLAGHSDWRIPTIKELYSLINFVGTDPSGLQGDDTSGMIPYIDTDYFIFEYGDTSKGERIIDSQYGSSTEYVSGTGLINEDTLFGVNFADGRIKGYGLHPRGTDKTFFFMYVRGNSYGVNDFTDNGLTVTDKSTGLVWQKADSGEGMVWEDALSYCEGLELGDVSWRLPDAKELQNIADYTRSPDTTNSAAIDPVFEVSTITNEAGQADYPYYWTGTTHANHMNGKNAVYVSFGRAMGYMGGWTDVHGAGAQRSDPKTGDPDNYPTGHGPQGDAIRIYNYVRCVSG